MIDAVTMQPRMDLDDLKAAARQQVEIRRVAWEQERTKLDREITEVARTKTSMPNNYWHAEHRARALYATALNFLESLSE